MHGTELHGQTREVSDSAVTYLVAKADAEDTLLGGDEVLDEEAQPQYPQLVGVRIVGAPANDEAVVFVEVLRGRELPVHRPEHVPHLLAVAAATEGTDEDVEVAAVRLDHVLGVPSRHQQRVPPAPHWLILS